MLEIEYLHIAERLQLAGLRWPMPGFMALIGPNGSGKSTLLSALAGLIPAHMRARLAGDALPDVDMAREAGRRAMLPQRQATALPMPAWEVLDMPRHLFPGQSAAWQQALAEVSERLALGPLLGRDFSRLSGGEQQRLLIGKTVLQVWPSLNPQARLLLLDEPLAALDWHHQLQVCALLRDLARQGIQIICALHDFNLAVAWADQLLCLQQGQVVAAGDIALLDSALLAQVFGVHTGEVRVQGQRGYLPLGVMPPSSV